MADFKGSIVALVTPFKKNGLVDEPRLRKQIEWQIKSGTNGLVPCGTTGESPTLSHEEHKKVISITVEQANKRVPVIAGTGSNSTEEAVQLTKYAKKVGADASLSVVPYYNKPTQEGLYQHFKTIASKTSLRVVLYNIPGRSGVALSGDTICRLSRVEGIVAVKEATGSMDVATDIIQRTKLTVLSGDDSLTLPLMALGAQGVISVLANIYPQLLADMIQLIWEDDWSEARKYHQLMFPLCKALFVETNPIPVKTAMKIMKMDTGVMRLPLSAISSSNLSHLKRSLLAFKKSIGVKGLV